MKVKCTCLYCGYTWIKYIYYDVKSLDELELICEKAGCYDKNVKVASIQDSDVFGYTKKFVKKDG